LGTGDGCIRFGVGNAGEEWVMAQFWVRWVPHLVLGCCVLDKDPGICGKSFAANTARTFVCFIAFLEAQSPFCEETRSRKRCWLLSPGRLLLFVLVGFVCLQLSLEVATDESLRLFV
jgi:hypothetical protein